MTDWQLRPHLPPGSQQSTCESIDCPDGNVFVAREPHGAESCDRVNAADIGISITDLDANKYTRVSVTDCDHFLHTTTASAQ
ncbi:hypothetical protein GCM10027406_08040 [Leifsonia lichenia]